MSKWIFRLTGLLVLVPVIFSLLDGYLNPDVPDYIEQGVGVRTQGEQPTSPPAVSENAPPLSLTSIEGDTPDPSAATLPALSQASSQTPTANATQPTASDAAPITLTALDESESIPVLSNPDSPRANVWLQVGSFAERANAEKRGAVLKAHSWPVDIASAVVEGKTYYRVYLGPLTPSQVTGYMDKLTTMGISAREVNR